MRINKISFYEIVDYPNIHTIKIFGLTKVQADYIIQILEDMEMKKNGK